MDFYKHRKYEYHFNLISIDFYESYGPVAVYILWTSCRTTYTRRSSSLPPQPTPPLPPVPPEPGHGLMFYGFLWHSRRFYSVTQWTLNSLIRTAHRRIKLCRHRRSAAPSAWTPASWPCCSTRAATPCARTATTPGTPSPARTRPAPRPWPSARIQF